MHGADEKEPEGVKDEEDDSDTTAEGPTGPLHDDLKTFPKGEDGEFIGIPAHKAEL